MPDRILELEGWHWARGEFEQLAAPLHIRGLNTLLPLMPLHKKQYGDESDDEEKSQVDPTDPHLLIPSKIVVDEINEQA